LEPFCASYVARIGHSMLDWPLAIQTSPTITPSSTMEFLPVTVSLSGPPASSFGSRAIHRPPTALVVTL
jgi:hypothetical protein